MIIKENNQGSSIILLTALIMAAMLTIALTANEIIQKGLGMARVQINSTKAYFAAEAGAERILWEVRNNGYDINSHCDNLGSYIPFTQLDPTLSAIDTGASCDNDNTDHNETQKFITGNDAEYQIFYKYDNTLPTDKTTIYAIGNYKDEVRRVIELTY